jgi:5-hydroxyisourate hydrolase
MSSISTHILDTARGIPAPNVSIRLHRLKNDQWDCISEGKTNSDGRVKDIHAPQPNLSAGIYKMHFATGDYFLEAGDEIFYPYAEVVFVIDKNTGHYHIPLLLSPFGYSTYRGS